MNEDQKKALIIEIRMRLAANRQYLRDASDWMSEDEKNEVLDWILKLTDLLNELEKKP